MALLPKTTFTFIERLYSSFFVMSDEADVLLVVLLAGEAFVLAVVLRTVLLAAVDFATVRLFAVPVAAFLVALGDEAAVVVVVFALLDLRVPVVVDLAEELLDAVLLLVVALLAVLVTSAFLAASFAAKRATCSTSKSTFALSISSCCSFC
ncbi:membrane hypothetical protein [Alteromonas macleodii]